jgi:hypothetical protein
MAPNLSGIESSDAARVQHLIELAVEFAQNHMKPQGALVVKVFHGSGYSQIVKMFKETFKVVKPIKPKASRDKSSETFLVGMGLIQGPLMPLIPPFRGPNLMERLAKASGRPRIISHFFDWSLS